MQKSLEILSMGILAHEAQNLPVITIPGWASSKSVREAWNILQIKLCITLMIMSQSSRIDR